MTRAPAWDPVLGCGMAQRHSKVLTTMTEHGWRARLRGPRDFDFEAIEANPSGLEANEIFARTIRSAVSLGTERSAYVGDPPLRPGPVYPRKVGYCNVARVERVGTSVTGVRPGDQILTHQSHQSFFVCHERDVLAPVPSTLAPEHAAFTYLFCLGLAALQRTAVVAGERVGVLGLGVIGLTTLGVARALGARPVAFGNQVSRLQRAMEMGATHTFDTTSQDVLDHVGNAFQEGLDVLVTTANSWTAWQTVLRLVRPNGRIGVLGFPGRGEDTPHENPLDPAYFYDKQLSIHACGMTNGMPLERGEQLRANVRWVLQALEQKRLSVAPLESKTMSWRDLPMLYETVAQDRRAVLAATLDWEAS